MTKPKFFWIPMPKQLQGSVPGESDGIILIMHVLSKITLTGAICHSPKTSSVILSFMNFMYVISHTILLPEFSIEVLSAGLMEKIPYLKELGINAVEMMPIFEFDETMNSRTVDGNASAGMLGLQYSRIFCPKQQLCCSQRAQSGRNRTENTDQDTP